MFDGFNYHCIDWDDIVKLTPIKIIYHSHKMTRILTKMVHIIILMNICLKEMLIRLKQSFVTLHNPMVKVNLDKTKKIRFKEKLKQLSFKTINDIIKRFK